MKQTPRRGARQKMSLVGSSPNTLIFWLVAGVFTGLVFFMYQRQNLPSRVHSEHQLRDDESALLFPEFTAAQKLSVTPSVEMPKTEGPAASFTKNALDPAGSLKEPVPVLKSLRVDWRLPVGCDFSGFLVEVLGYLPALSAHLPGLRLSGLGDCSKLIQSDALTHSEAKILSQLQKGEEAVAVGRPQQEDVLIQHTWPRDYLQFKSSQRPLIVIGRSMCESQVLPATESAASDRVDEIWVPTAWHVEVFSKAGVPEAKLRVVPEAVDAAFFDPQLVSSSLHPEVDNALNKMDSKGGHGHKPFIFLSNFKWEQRKGWDILLEAYFSEFQNSEKGAVELVIKSYKPSWERGSDDLMSQIRDFARRKFNAELRDLPKVRWVASNDMSRKAMRDLYSQADVFVLPTRGEGWGLPAVEAMAMQVPVIVTNFSGPLGYLNSISGYPLPILGVDHNGFAVPCLKSLKSNMRWVHEHPQEVKEKGRLARREVIEKFSPEVVVSTMLERLRALYSDKEV